MNVNHSLHARAVAANACSEPEIGRDVQELSPYDLAWALTHMPLTKEERAEALRHPVVKRFAKRRGIPAE